MDTIVTRVSPERIAQMMSAANITEAAFKRALSDVADRSTHGGKHEYGPLGALLIAAGVLPSRIELKAVDVSLKEWVVLVWVPE